MTRKDFEFITSVLGRIARKKDSVGDVDGIFAVRSVAQEFANRLESENENFSRIKFFDSFGYVDIAARRKEVRMGH